MFPVLCITSGRGMPVLYRLSLQYPLCKRRHGTDNTDTVTLCSYITHNMLGKKRFQSTQCVVDVQRVLHNSPVLILEDKLPQFEVTEDQSVVVAMCHSRGYLIEQSGSFVLPQLLAGADERVHVAIASLEEHIGSSLPEQDLQDLVNVLVLAQSKVGRQRLLVSANVKNLQT